jgi:hypothetical protein
MKQIQTVMAVVSFLLSFYAYAGAESHGGQVVVCPGKETVMLDYYQATLPTEAEGVPELVDVSKMDSIDVLNLFKSRLINSDLEEPYSRALGILGPVNTWLEGSLQSIQDSDPAYTLPPDCVLQQVAIRQGTTMYVDPAVLAEISPAQQGVLMAHEALYYIAEQNGLTSSVQVRMVIRNLLLKELNRVQLSVSVHALGSKFFWWESIANSSYYDLSKSGRLPDFSLAYDPILDGENLNYSAVFNPHPGQGPIGLPIEDGTFNCDDEIYSTCHTTLGNHQCTLSNFGWGIGTNEIQADLTCSDLGFTLRISNFAPK